MPVESPPWSAWTKYPVLDFAVRVERAAASLPVAVSSWFRDPDHNRAVGGESKSQHLRGLARDYTGPAWALRVLAHRARMERLVPVSERDHLHVQAFPKDTV